MARYLVIHTPVDRENGAVPRPSDMAGLARAAGADDAAPRWLRAWSPDLHDDRIFTLWDAKNADEVKGILERYGFLDQVEIQALRVWEWGPAEVIAAETTP